MLELWLIRHGETLWNREDRIQGQSDPPLSDLGVQQAKRLAKRFQEQAFDAVYSSDLDRAHMTARLVLPGAKVKTDTRLREISFGNWEGQIWRDLKSDEGALLERWWRDPYENRAPGGESYRNLSERVKAWLAELPKVGKVIAFSHGGTIRSALYAHTGQPEGGVWRFHLDNTSINRVLIGEGEVTLLTVNDAAHLEGWSLD